MNNLIKENKRIFTFILLMLFVLLLFVYFAFVNPEAKKLKAAKSNVTTLDTEITTLELNIDRLTNSTDLEAILLEKKVPLTPELESLLLTFQEIELASGSRIEDISFRYDGELPENSIQEIDRDDDSSNEEGNVSDESTEESASEVTQDVNKPENLRLVTAVLNTKSPSYEHFKDFLTEVERRERIMRVDNLKFEKPAERELVLAEVSDETVTFTIEVTTFYYAE